MPTFPCREPALGVQALSGLAINSALCCVWGRVQAELELLFVNF
jgi:hypothetical protein